MRGAGFLLACAILFGMATVLTGGQLPAIPGKGEEKGRRNVTLSVTQKQLRTRPIDKQTLKVLITYKSSDSGWQGPITWKTVDPWNHTVSVRIGATVSLNANQTVANELTCIISVPSTGAWSNPSTRRSIGSVNCSLFIV